MECKCGSQSFQINEGLVWEAVTDGEKLKALKVEADEIEQIFCANCGAEYVEPDFEKIKFPEQ